MRTAFSVTVSTNFMQTEGESMRKDPAWAGRAEAGSSTAAANSPARQAHFLSPGPRGEWSQCSVCDPRQTATLSGPQGPLPPEVEDPGGSVGRGPPASALAFLPPVHTTPPSSQLTLRRQEGSRRC